MKSRPRITVVIAVLNAEQALRTTLASLESQSTASLAQIEVIVVDGGSSDGTVDVAAASPLLPQIISEPDDGIYDAMNKGAARSAGTWLHFLNAGDAFSSPDSLAAALLDLERADRAKRTWYVAGAKFVGGPVDGLRIPNLPHRWREHALGLQPHCHQATWFRSDLFAALGGYSLDYGFVGDFDLILRWGATGAPQTNEAILIDYLYGGLSEQRAAEIPTLTRRVRAERLQLDPLSKHLDMLQIVANRASNTVERYGSRAVRFGRALIGGSSGVPSGTP